MKWLNKSNSMYTDTTCGIHVCYARDDGDSCSADSCIARVCLTKACYADF